MKKATGEDTYSNFNKNKLMSLYKISSPRFFYNFLCSGKSRFSARLQPHFLNMKTLKKRNNVQVIKEM